MSAPVRIFYSYSHKDEKALDSLKDHLAEVRREGLIEDWHDRRIEMGTDWSRAIESALEEADLIVLLISSDFLASDYCNGIELTRAMERARAGEARIVPVHVRPVRWTGAPFARFQGLPKDAKPVSSWRNQDEAWVEVAEGIVRAAQELRGEAEPMRRLFVRSPGLPRSRVGPWLAALTLGALLIAGLGLACRWWCPTPCGELTDMLTSGNAFLETGQYEQALDVYQKTLDREPDCAKAALGREKADLFAHIGPGFDAAAVRTKLSAMEHNHLMDAHIQLMLGRLEAAEGDSESARDRYRRALALDAEYAQAWFRLGSLDDAKGEHRKAEEHYRKALALAPDHPPYLTNLAGLLLEQGSYAAALEIYDGLLTLNPRLLLARIDAGNGARLAGDLRLARAHHERLRLDLDRTAVLEQGDNAAQWAFDLPGEVVTMDTPDSKRAYALLTVSLTRFLDGDRDGAAEAVSGAADSPELLRARAVIDYDLTRLSGQRPEWRGSIHAYRRLLELPTP